MRDRKRGNWSAARRLRAVLGAAMLMIAACITGVALADTSVPPGFEDREISPDLNGSTAFDFAPDGRIFVGEKGGVVKVVRQDGTLVTLLDLRSRVNSYVDRGLLGLAVDTDFETNGFVYLLYVYEDNPLLKQAPKVSRLTRIQVRPDNTLVNPSSPETVILGKQTLAPCPAPSNTADCIPADGVSHVIGTVRSAPDGTLFVGTGDANHKPQNNVDPYRPYDELSFAGKIMHVDRNGRGLPGHPFCPLNGNLSHVCTKIFAKGFRNPFRFTVHPDGNSLVVGDVGDATMEEVDIVRAGRNYGWPCYEGSIRTPRFRNTERCQSEYAKEATGGGPAAPLWTYGRENGAAVIGGPFYPHDGPFPSSFHGTILVGDYVQGWVKRLRVDSAGRLAGVEDFVTGWVGVDLNLTPAGNVAYTDFQRIRQLSFTTGNRAPVARASADHTAGPLPLTVAFTGSASSDPDGDAVTYHWDFGDGDSSSEADPSHTYTAKGDFTATLTVTDTGGETDTATVAISAGNEAPVVSIDSPADGSLYRTGSPLTLRGSAQDPDDGVLSGDALNWRIRLHHNTHVHEFDELTGGEVSFTPLANHDADSHYEVILTATDSGGLSRSRTITVHPETVTFTIESQPYFAPVTYDGTARVAPWTTTAAVGFEAVISAGERYKRGGNTYVFDHWSDGGAQQHTVTIPDRETKLIAVYRQATLLDLLTGG